MVKAKQIRSKHADYEAIEGMWMLGMKHACITAAIDLEIFDTLASGPETNVALAKRLNLNVRPLESLLNLLTNLGFLAKDLYRFRLSSKADVFLSKSSKFSLHEEFTLRVVRNLNEKIVLAIRRLPNPRNSLHSDLTDGWEKGAISERDAIGFTRAMQRLTYYPAYHHSKNKVFSTLESLIDIGGGSGAWATSLTEHHQRLTVTVFELPPVIKAAKKVLHELDVDVDRIKFISGNFFKDGFPSGDSYMLSNILHDWPIEKCEKIVKKVAQVAPKGTRVFIHECLIDENRQGSEFACIFDLLMAINHRSQQLSKLQIDKLLLKYGFSRSRKVAKIGSFDLLVGVKK